MLDLGRAQNHLRESERAGLGLRMIEHALGNATAAVALLEIHAAKLGLVNAVAFDAKTTDDFTGALDHPKGVALGFRKNLGKLLQFAIDDRRDISLEYFLHPGRRQLAVDARP